MRAKVWKVCTEEREADCSRQEVRQTSGGDVLRGAKKQKGGAKMEWGAELLNVHLRHVFICTLASANVSPPFNPCSRISAGLEMSVNVVFGFSQ